MDLVECLVAMSGTELLSEWSGDTKGELWSKWSLVEAAGDKIGGEEVEWFKGGMFWEEDRRIRIRYWWGKSIKRNI